MSELLNMAEVAARAQIGWDFGKGRQKHPLFSKPPPQLKDYLHGVRFVSSETFWRDPLGLCFSSGINERINIYRALAEAKSQFYIFTTILNYWTKERLVKISPFDQTAEEHTHTHNCMWKFTFSGINSWIQVTLVGTFDRTKDGWKANTEAERHKSMLPATI